MLSNVLQVTMTPGYQATMFLTDMGLNIEMAS
jgi:hypothetical protein